MLAVGRTHHKNPNLGEAYEFFTGEKLQNAHSAMADVLGCIAVYFGVKDKSEEHTSELQSLMRSSYAVLCLKKKTNDTIHYNFHEALFSHVYKQSTQRND